MYKSLLIETLPAYGQVNMEKLAQQSGIELARLSVILSNENDFDVSEREYIAIAKALPVSAVTCIKSAAVAVQDLEYLERQLNLVVEASDDDALPLFEGMRRLVRRVITSL